MAQSGVSGAEENHAVDQDLGGTPEQGKMEPVERDTVTNRIGKRRRMRKPRHKREQGQSGDQTITGRQREGEGLSIRMVNRHDEVRDIVPRQRYTEARVVHRRDQCTETCGDQGGRRQRGTN